MIDGVLDRMIRDLRLLRAQWALAEGKHEIELYCKIKELENKINDLVNV